MKKSVWCILLLTIPLFGFAQDDFPKEIQRKLTQYYSDNLPVRIALFFNQPEYAPGDTVWFKVAFVAQADHRPIGNRQIININLIAENGQNIVHQKILVNDGYGFNQLVIPPSLPSGVYSFLAHSDWMKNFDQSLFASHNIIVSGEKTIKKKIPVDIKVYPEGGSFVGGVTNKVAAVGVPGANVTFTNTQGQVVTCRLNEFGIGTAYLFPAVTDTYQVVEGTRTSELRTVAGKNVSINIDVPDGKAAPLKISLTHNGQSNSAEVFYLLIHASGDVYHASRVSFNSGQKAEVSVDQVQLREGLMIVTLFRENRTVEAERMIFLGEGNAVQTTLQTDRSTYACREKVTLQIDMKDRAGTPIASLLGVTVFNNELFSQTNTGSSRLIQLPDPAAYTEGTNLNEWLITQRWKQFEWDDVLNNRKKNKYKLKSNLQFAGRVIDGEKLAKDGAPVVSFFLARDVRIYAEYLKKDGTFDFSLFFDFENKEIIYYTIEKSGTVVKDARMIVESDSLVFSGHREQYVATTTPSPYGQFANAHRALHAAYKGGSVDDMKSKQVNPHAFLEEEVFDADVSIDLSRYLIFPTMEETLREIVPSLQHRWKNQQHTVRARIIEPDAIPKGDPIYFIDGVLTGSTDYFMSLKPEDVSRIKIIRSQRKLSAFGSIGKNGIVLVETKLVDNASRVPHSLNSFVATGLTPQINFKTPNVNSTALARTPIFRSTLYWNPSVTVGPDGKAVVSFFTADNTGTFTIRVDGLAANGSPVTEEKVIEVKFAKPNN